MNAKPLAISPVFLIEVRITFKDGTQVKDFVSGFSEADAIFNACWEWPFGSRFEVVKAKQQTFIPPGGGMAPNTDTTIVSAIESISGTR